MDECYPRFGNTISIHAFVQYKLLDNETGLFKKGTVEKIWQLLKTIFMSTTFISDTSKIRKMKRPNSNFALKQRS